MFAAHRLSLWTPDREPYRWRAFPAVLDPLQVVVEESLLQGKAGIAVEFSMGAAGMHLEPLMRGTSLEIGFDIAAPVQAHPAPISGRQQGHPDAGKDRRGLPIGLVFKRTYAIDADFMFMISDQVENRGDFANTELAKGVEDRWGEPVRQPAPSARAADRADRVCRAEAGLPRVARSTRGEVWLPGI